MLSDIRNCPYRKTTKLYDVTVASSKALQSPNFPQRLPRYSFEALPSFTFVAHQVSELNREGSGCECVIAEFGVRPSICELETITMPRVRYLTVEEAVEMEMNDIDSVDGDIDVVNIPPDDSDEDEGNDECVGVAEVADVPGEVEVHFQTPPTEDDTPPPPPSGKKRRTEHGAPTCSAIKSRSTLAGRRRLTDRRKLERRSLASWAGARLWRFLRKSSHLKCSI